MKGFRSRLPCAVFGVTPHSRALLKMRENPDTTGKTILIFSVSALELVGAEGQHGSVAAGNFFMLRCIPLSVQVQSGISFAQRC